MIKIKRLTYYYPNSSKPALNNVNLTIQDGSFVLVAGPSGSGKSTLCKSINGLVPHFYGGKFSGEVEVEELNTLKHTPRDLAKIVGMVFQEPENQLVSLSVEREIAFTLENFGYPPELMPKKIEEVLYALNIPHLRRRATGSLSGGELQKVALGSVLAVHPKILVLDEPTSQLDPKSAEEILNVVKNLNDELGVTVIVTEHRLDRVIQHVDQLILMKNGEIKRIGDPETAISNINPRLDGVSIPPVSELGIKLGVTPIPLTVKEGRRVLKPFFKRTRRVVFKKRVLVDPPLLEVKNVWFSYNGKDALKNVTFKVSQGEFVAVIGRNASGKTTLARILTGLLKPYRGDVLLNGSSIKEKTVAELAGKIGYVPQNPEDALFADTVESEVSFILKNLGLDKREITRRVNSILEKFGIANLKGRYPLDLSSGEKQRVALASILVFRPEVLVLDEPTRGMDANCKKALMNVLNSYKSDGTSIIFMSHDVELIAKHVDRVIILSDGEIVYDGEKHKALSDSLYFSPQINRLTQNLTQGIQGDILTVEEAISALGRNEVHAR